VLSMLPRPRTFSGPQPRPSRISIVIDRDTTSRDARSFADGAYLPSRMRVSLRETIRLLPQCLRTSGQVLRARKQGSWRVKPSM